MSRLGKACRAARRACSRSPAPRQEAVPTPVKTADAPQAVPAEDAAKADDEPAEEPSTQGETAEEPAAGDKSGEAQPAEDKPAEDKAAEEVVDGQGAVRVVEKIIVVEKAPATVDAHEDAPDAKQGDSEN